MTETDDAFWFKKLAEAKAQDNLLASKAGSYSYSKEPERLDPFTFKVYVDILEKGSLSSKSRLASMQDLPVWIQVGLAATGDKDIIARLLHTQGRASSAGLLLAILDTGPQSSEVLNAILTILNQNDTVDRNEIVAVLTKNNSSLDSYTQVLLLKVCEAKLTEPYAKKKDLTDREVNALLYNYQTCAATVANVARQLRETLETNAYLSPATLRLHKDLIEHPNTHPRVLQWYVKLPDLKLVHLEDNSYELEQLRSLAEEKLETHIARLNHWVAVSVKEDQQSTAKQLLDNGFIDTEVELKTLLGTVKPVKVKTNAGLNGSTLKQKR